jgi:hypothetical protein
LFELVLLLLEIVVEVLVEFVVAFGSEALKGSVREKREASPVLAATGHLLFGIAAGVLSLLILGQRLAPAGSVPGLSLILGPIGTGIVMHWIGQRWREHGRETPALFSFRAGAIFAFGMALVRFVYLELGWLRF